MLSTACICNSSNSPLHPILSTPCSAVDNPHTFRYIRGSLAHDMPSASTSVFDVCLPSGRSPPSHHLYLSRLKLFHLNPKTCAENTGSSAMSLAWHRLQPSGPSSRGLPKQWVYVLHLPSTWHRIGLVAISGINKETKEIALQLF